MDDLTQSSLLPELVNDKKVKPRKKPKRLTNPMLRLEGEHTRLAQKCRGCSYLLPVSTGIGELFRCLAYDLRKGAGNDHNPSGLHAPGGPTNR